MMPECDLDDNDPLSEYLKRAPMMIGTKAKAKAARAPVSSCICCLGVPLHDGRLDSIKALLRERQESVNHAEIDKVEATEVSKYECGDCVKIAVQMEKVRERDLKGKQKVSCVFSSAG
jgi:hypothetical protein